MKRYIDAFALPIPKKNLKAYLKLAKESGKVWMEYGALAYTEAVGEDMTKHPFCLSFADSFKAKKGETIIVAFITYKTRAHRDRVNKKVMADPRMDPEKQPKDMPFDCARMAWNGFETIVNHTA